jgi:proton-dependent oligopeptide transporter, POT family
VKSPTDHDPTALPDGPDPAASVPVPHVAVADTAEPTAEERNPSGKTFFGQPGPLANLFSVELWERFSFYGMQGILAIYMYWSASRGGLGIDEGVALSLVGAYGGMVYVFCILGGWVADRLIGSERTMFISAVLIMLGHIALALVPGVPGLIAGMVLVAVGSGGLKANVANLVGGLYTRDDPRRDAGFSIYYMGVNIGGLFGPLLTGLAQQQWGFHVGFGLAAVGMAIGLTQYTLTRKNLPAHVHEVPDPLPRSQYPRWIAIALAALVVLGLAIGAGWIHPGNLAIAVTLLSAVAAVVLFGVILASKKVTGLERTRVVAFIPLFIGSAAFFALFQQQFTVITYYSDTRLDRELNLFGTTWEMPLTWVQSFNPFFIIVLAPVFAWIWTKLGRRQPNTPIKFGVGIALMGSAFLLFLPMIGVANVAVLWVAFIMLVATLGELMVSPVGLSLSTKLAPAAFPVMMVALYNLSVALGSALSGSLAKYYTEETEGAYFGILGAVTIGIGVLTLLGAKPIHKAMRGVS